MKPQRQPEHLGMRMLYCLACRTFREHEVAWDEDHSYKATCTTCDRIQELAPPNGEWTTGVALHARGPYLEHDWRRSSWDNLWYRACAPRSRKYAAAGVAKVPLEGPHRPCPECVKRREVRLHA